MSETTLSVSAIHNGTVIDHIPVGQAITMIRLLRLTEHTEAVTVGFNLFSKQLGLKDLVKIENRELTEQEHQEIATFAPSATINIIRNGIVIEKKTMTLPKKIEGFLRCPNVNCITRFEPVKTLFYVQALGQHVEVCCHFCEKVFPRHEMKEYAL